MFLFLHLAWAAAGIFGIVMAVISKGGHPPALVLLPAVLGIWLLGHIFIWISQWLVKRSAKSIFAEQTTRQRWPPSVLLVTVLTGVTCFIAAIVGGVLMYKGSPHGEGVMFLVIAGISAIVFAGLLARKNWSRLIVIVLLISHATWLALEMAQSLWKGYAHPLNDWLIASGLFIVLVGLGMHWLKSKRVRNYFGGR